MALLDQIPKPLFDVTSFISPDDPASDVEDDAPDGLEEATAAVLEAIRLRVEAKAAPPRTDYTAGFDDPPPESQATATADSPPSPTSGRALSPGDNPTQRDSSTRRFNSPSSRSDRNQSSDRSRSDRPGGDRNRDPAAGNRSDQAGRRSVMRPQPNRRDQEESQRPAAAERQRPRTRPVSDDVQPEQLGENDGDREPEFGTGVSDDATGESRTRSRRRRRRRGGAATEKTETSGGESRMDESSASGRPPDIETGNAESVDPSAIVRKRRRSRRNGRSRRGSSAEGGDSSGGAETPAAD